MATKKHSKNFAKYRYAYKLGCYTAQMLQMLVGKGVLTADEYEEITGEKYTA